MEQCLTAASVGARLQKTKEHVLAKCSPSSGHWEAPATTTPTSTCSNHRSGPLHGASALLLALLMLLGGGQCGLFYNQPGGCKHDGFAWSTSRVASAKGRMAHSSLELSQPWP